MKYEDFDFDNCKKGLPFLIKLIGDLKGKDVIYDGSTEVKITSRFENIFWYISVNKDIIINNDFSKLKNAIMSDSYKEVRLIDFLKDYENFLPSKYSDYVNQLLDDVFVLYSSYLNAKEYRWLFYETYSSKMFKQYIINIVYIFIDIYNSVFKVT